MPGRIGGYAAMLAFVAVLSGCGGGDLITLSNPGEGPDEFAILPNKPLQSPDNLSALPPPTPGGPNRSDQTPEADAVAALGGSASATVGGGVRGPGLVAHARRFGTDPDIRRTLAAEDAAFRRGRGGRPLERLFGTTLYYRVYAPQSLDQYAELERFRRLGVRTPAAPPAGLAE